MATAFDLDWKGLYDVSTPTSRTHCELNMGISNGFHLVYHIQINDREGSN